MTDRYAAHNASFTAPASHGFAVTPHDTNDLSEVTRGLYVGTGGDVCVILREGATLTFTNVQSGSVLPVRASRVKATGTTATAIVGLV